MIKKYFEFLREYRLRRRSKDEVRYWMFSSSDADFQFTRLNPEE
jgi:hypothetical protein